jgi:hypothetical protein
MLPIASASKLDVNSPKETNRSPSLRCGTALDDFFEALIAAPVKASPDLGDPMGDTCGCCGQSTPECSTHQREAAETSIDVAQ